MTRTVPGRPARPDVRPPLPRFAAAERAALRQALIKAELLDT